MKIDISQIKKWTILKVDTNLFKITDFSHTHTWRWVWTYAVRVKNIITWNTLTLSYKSWTILEQAEVNTKSAIYLYNSGDKYCFMENDSSEIHEIDKDVIEDTILFLKENLDLYLVIYQDNIISVILPPSIKYKISSTVPWVKWDRQSAWKKPAILETWLEVNIPLHLNEWDEVFVNTTTYEVC